MKIRFFGPFADAIGKEAVIDLKQDTAFRDIIDMLRDRYDVLSPYLSDVKSDEELSYRIVFLKKGMPLKLDETVPERRYDPGTPSGHRGLSRELKAFNLPSSI